MTDKIDPTKQYRTREGKEWRFLEFTPQADPLSKFAVQGAYKDNDYNWRCNAWSLHGKFTPNEMSIMDLIEVRPRIQRKVWINVYSGVPGEAHESRKEADRWSDPGRTECLEITLDYEKGEGL
jgi:hypothetical protein